MPSLDATDPGMTPMQPDDGRRRAYFSIREWAGFASLVAMAVAALFFLIRTEVRPVEKDLNHHVVTDDQRHDEHCREIEALEKADQSQTKALHRIELRQVRTAPRGVLPASLRDPPPPEPSP